MTDENYLIYKKCVESDVLYNKIIEAKIKRNNYLYGSYLQTSKPTIDEKQTQEPVVNENYCYQTNNLCSREERICALENKIALLEAGLIKQKISATELKKYNAKKEEKRKQRKFNKILFSCIMEVYDIILQKVLTNYNILMYSWSWFIRSTKKDQTINTYYKNIISDLEFTQIEWNSITHFINTCGIKKYKDFNTILAHQVFECIDKEATPQNIITGFEKVILLCE